MKAYFFPQQDRRCLAGLSFFHFSFHFSAPVDVHSMKHDRIEATKQQKSNNNNKKKTKKNENREKKNWNEKKQRQKRATAFTFFFLSLSLVSEQIKTNMLSSDVCIDHFLPGQR